MIREFAFGLSNRHHFFPSNNSVKWENVAKDTFLSLYGYDDSVVKFFEAKKTLSGYDGDIYMPKEFILDVDGVEIEEAQDKAIKLVKMGNVKAAAKAIKPAIDSLIKMKCKKIILGCTELPIAIFAFKSFENVKSSKIFL